MFPPVEAKSFIVASGNETLLGVMPFSWSTETPSR